MKTIFVNACLKRVWPIFLILFSLNVIAQDRYRIDKPDVSRSNTEYPYIKINAGDIVYISAGGCIQTGGSGKTWKRYVDPQGPDSDRLYHGLISIPGVTRGYERIANYLNSNISIPLNSSGGALGLGYEDDNYSDNGYEGRDPGTGDQCVGQPNAYVEIIIKRYVAQAKTNPQPEKTGTQPNSQPDQSNTQPATQEPKVNQPSAQPDNTNPPTTSYPDTTKESFFQTLPGILTALAAFITAIVALIQVFKPKK